MSSSTFVSSLDNSTSNLFPCSGLVPFTAVVMNFCILAIVLRFWARYVSTGLDFSLDDWFVFAALPLTLIKESLILVLLNHGDLGQHESGLVKPDPGGLIYTMKFLYIAQLFFDVDTSLVRFSALAFYGRIFHVRRNPSKVWRIAYYGTICLSVAWLVAQFLFDAFSCHPLSDFWAPRVLRPCVPPSTFFLVGSAGDFIANLLVLLLPLPQVLRLDLEWRKKISISLAFIFGYGAAFMSLGRLITTLEIGTDINEDVTFLVVPLIYWYIAEVGLSIVAICLPAIFQLGRRGHRQGLHSLFHTEKSMFRTSNIMANGTDSRMDQETSRLWQPEWDWNNLYNGPSFDAYVTAGSTSGKEEPTTEGINVRKDVDIVMSNMR